MINIVGKNKHVDLALQRTSINTISSTTVVMIELCWNTQVILFAQNCQYFKHYFVLLTCADACIGVFFRRDFFCCCYGFKFIIFLQRFRVIITAAVLHCFWFVICLLVFVYVKCHDWSDVHPCFSGTVRLAEILPPTVTLQPIIE